MKKVLIIAGEASGDLHGGGVVRELLRLRPGTSVFGIGGDRMRGAGMELVHHIGEMAFMGFAEVLRNLPFIRRVERELEELLRLLYPLARLREMMVSTNMKLFGHRFIMDRVVPGGVSVDIDAVGKEAMLAEMDILSKDFERLVVIYDEHSSLEDRVRDTGILTPESARELCVVGIVARASGLNLDCRIFNPFPPFDKHDYLELDVPVLISGDVHARAWVRIQEIRESIRIIRTFLEDMPSGEIAAPVALPRPDISGFAAVEGWRGEIMYWLQSGPHSEVNRCMVRDPSSEG